MIELQGKYTNAKIYADTIEDGVYSQVYDIINCKAFENKKVVCMPDVHELQQAMRIMGCDKEIEL